MAKKKKEKGDFKCICGRDFKKEHHLKMHQDKCEVYKDSVKIEEHITIEVQTKDDAQEETKTDIDACVYAGNSEEEAKALVEERKAEITGIIRRIRSYSKVTQAELKEMALEFTKVTGKSAWSITCKTSVYAMTNVLIENGYK